MAKRNAASDKPKAAPRAKPSPAPEPTNSSTSAALSLAATLPAPALAAAFPIVGIGASAGGLAAFEAFFSGMPANADPNMAFVLVQHLAPDHKSLLVELVQRYTRMQVFEAEDGMTVAANCVYIISPNHDLAVLNGRLQLFEHAVPRQQRLPIDFFFSSLAQDQHEHAIAIVLSGTGSDGTLGLRSIKDEGGMVIVQTPDSAEFDGMPTSAIATGLADYTLAPAAMPEQLMAYAAYAFGNYVLPTLTVVPKSENAQKKILILLRSQTGHDFSLYKPSTINRRIARRLAVHKIDKLSDYVKFLEQSSDEVQALFQDLLIGVTSFFRDPEAFQALQEQIGSKLLEGKPNGAVIRIWVPGCSTGEEAYSLAMLLVESMEQLRQSFALQIFATDIDAHAIAVARIGLYPDSIAADLTPERLKRFFSPEADSNAYRIHKGIRDMLVFSEQDLIRDPPFSRLDLISCRNLMIYMGSELQKMLIPMFHYALKPGGILFLGTSETVGEFVNLFSPLERKAKLYQRRQDLGAAQSLALGRFLPPATKMGVAIVPNPAKTPFPMKLPARDLAEQALLRHVTPPGALVNASGDILYLHGRTGMYLEPVTGEPGVYNILKMARQGLQRELALALHQAKSAKQVVVVPVVRVKTNGHFSSVKLAVYPINPAAPGSDESPLFLVVLEEISATDTSNQATPDTAPSAKPATEAQLQALEEELRSKEDYVQSYREEMETSNEELKSTVEEMQSVNEELQSTNEELETAKEEMQSVNEELATVNTELQNKVADLARVNNDMSNLLAGTGIATIFVDRQMRILRFTPMAAEIINLISNDVGRQVGHILPNLVNYPHLVRDTQTVLDTLVPQSLEVQTQKGQWFELRITPYRTLEHVIEGAVISFIDITEIVHTRTVLAKSELRFASVVAALSEAVVLHDRAGNIVAWNPAAERILGLSGEQLKGRKTLDPRWHTIHENGTPFAAHTQPSQKVFRTGQAQLNVIMGIDKPDGTLAWISINAVPIFDPGDPKPALVAVTFSDITERKAAAKPAPSAPSDQAYVIGA